MKIVLSKSENATLKYLWKNRHSQAFHDASFRFDYPHYLGLPKKFSNNLSSGFVDLLQDTIPGLNNYLSFPHYKKYLLDSISL